MADYMLNHFLVRCGPTFNPHGQNIPHSNTPKGVQNAVRCLLSSSRCIWWKLSSKSIKVKKKIALLARWLILYYGQRKLFALEAGVQMLVVND